MLEAWERLKLKLGVLLEACVHLLCIKDPSIAHERTRVVYEGYSRGREYNITNLVARFC